MKEDKVKIEHRYLLDIETKERLIRHLNYTKAVLLGIPFGAWLMITIYLWIKELKTTITTVDGDRTLNIFASINSYIFVLGMVASCIIIVVLWYLTYWIYKEEIE